MANKVYQNFVLEAKIEDMYNTHVNMNEYLTVDNDLMSAAGDKKVINVYSATGDVDDVTMGNGNTSTIEATYSPEEYTVGKTQGRGVYYDEEVDKDPAVIDVIVTGMAAKMANDHTTKVINEYKKARMWEVYSTVTFDVFADAIAKFDMEADEAMFAFIHPKDVSSAKKTLKDDLKYVEGFSRTGYIGSICGVPLITNKAVPSGEIYVATKAAVKLFNKRGMEVEYDRDKDLRKNIIYNRKTCLVALANAKKLVRLRKAPTALIDAADMAYLASNTASATAGSTIVHINDTPNGYKWAYKAGAAAATCTFGTAISGYTDITADDTTIAMSANTHLTVALVNSTDSKPIGCITFTGGTLKVGE